MGAEPEMVLRTAMGYSVFLLIVDWRNKADTALHRERQMLFKSGKQKKNRYIILKSNIKMALD